MEFHEKEPFEKGFATFFKEYVNPHVEQLEKRRSRCLSLLRLNALIAVLLVVTLPLTEPLVSAALDGLGEAVSDLVEGSGHYRHQTSQLKWMTYGLTLLVAMMLVLLPIFRYRRHTRKIKVDNIYHTYEKLSLKEIIFNHLLKFFGNLAFSREKGVSLVDLRGAMILPEYDECRAEDRISGVYRGTKIDISEMKLISRYKGRRVAVFSGLVVVLDICNPDAVLRGPFNGNTVVIQDDRKNLGYIKSKFKGYERVDLPTPALERRFEIFTTDKNEAKTFICERFLAAVLKLADAVQTTSGQITHIDDRVMYWFSQKVKFLGSAVLSLLFLPLSVVHFVRGGGFFFYWDVEPFSPSKHVDIYKHMHAADMSEVQAMNEDVECSFYKDKILITIPCEHDLFEPNSIFEPALIEEDIHLFFTLMHTIGEISDIVDEKKN